MCILIFGLFPFFYNAFFLFLADIWSNFIITWSLQTHAIWSYQLMWKVDVTGEISIPKLAEVNFCVWFFFFCFYLHVCTHTENNPEKCASFPNDWSSLQTETSFSCVFPPSFARFGFGESRETIWVLLKRQYRCLTEATVSSFIFIFLFFFPLFNASLKVQWCFIGISPAGRWAQKR